jgi:hypothetical protein
LSTNAQTLYNLVIHFIEKTPRDDEPDPLYREGMEVIKQECKSIVDILEQDSVERNFKSLIKVYIPRSTGVANEDRTYLDWMEVLIRDLLTGRPMWQTVSNQSQTSGQTLATTNLRLYRKPTNKERSMMSTKKTVEKAQGGENTYDG